MKESKLTIAVVAAVCIGLLLSQFVFSVRMDEMVVLYRFNKVKKVIKPNIGLAGEGGTQKIVPGETGAEVVERAGWFIKLPWPVDRVVHYDQRIRTLDGPLTQQQLPDDNQIIPRVYATWQVVDPVAFERSLKSDEEEAKKRLKEIISNQSGVVFGRHTLNDVVNTDPEELEFDQIEQEIFQSVKKSLTTAESPYGIRVCSMGISWITLPQQTTQAVFMRMQAERMRVAETLRAEGQRLRRTIEAEAKEERDKIVAQAQAEAKKIRARGEAEAARFYDTFAKDQELAVFLRRLEAIRTIAAGAARSGSPVTFVISTKTEPFSLLEQRVGEKPSQQVPGLEEIEEVATGLNPSAEK